MDKQFITPPARARIACVSTDENRSALLRHGFSEAGYTCLNGDQSGDSDLGLVDLRERSISSAGASKLATEIRRRSPESSMVFLVRPDLPAASRAALRQSGEVVVTGENLSPAIERCRHLLRIRNLAEETGERLKSLATTNKLAEFPPIETSNAAPSILIAGQPGIAALAAIGAAQSVSKSCTGVMSVGQTMRALESKSFDCAVFIPESKNDPLFTLARSMRRHPKFQDLPVLFTARNEVEQTSFVERGAREVILDDHIRNDLGSRLQAWTRRARLTASMRRFLTACSGEAVRDRISGAFSSHFFQHHGARICARADQTNRPLALLGVRLQQYKSGAEDHRGHNQVVVLRQAATLLRRVTRAEDFLARIAQNLFVIALPSTLVEDAETIGRRIEGVITNTMFRGKSDDQIFSIDVEIAAIARAHGTCIEESVAGLLTSLNTAKKRFAES